MRLAVTGFVSAGEGSVASANALLLLELLRAGHDVVFFSKPSFVDPRPLVRNTLGSGVPWEFQEVDNRVSDRLRANFASWPGLQLPLSQWDAFCYNRLLVRRIREAHQKTPFDCVLWMGDYARGRIPGLAGVSFAQGPPGTDARSILRRWDEVRRLNPAAAAWMWRILACLRTSRVGWPPLRHSDRILVGSRQSVRTLEEVYHYPAHRIDAMPYPVDLTHFCPQRRTPRSDGVLRALWLGRIVPRKRLDLFLDGAAEAIRSGLPMQITVVGRAALLPGLEKLLDRFAFRESLHRIPFVPREEVPALLACQDVLVQPSEEENFGSSVAEAQACGLPVIVGSTNGNSDYLCPRDISLCDDRPATLADALASISQRILRGDSEAWRESRAFAEATFAPHVVATQLSRALAKAAKCR